MFVASGSDLDEILNVPCFVMQVKVYNLMQYEHGADDVLVMGTDGLWDVLSNQEVAEAVTTFLANCDPDDVHRSFAIFLSFFLLFNYIFDALILYARTSRFRFSGVCQASALFHLNVKLFCCTLCCCVAHIVCLSRINSNLRHASVPLIYFTHFITQAYKDRNRRFISPVQSGYNIFSNPMTAF